MAEETLDENFIDYESDKEQYYKIYFGNDANYYLRELKALKSDRSYSLNFWPFLFGILWMFYKKLYVPAIVLLGLQLTVGFIEDYLVHEYNLEVYQLYFDIFWMLGIGVLLAVYGNVLYLKHAQKNVETILSETEPGNSRNERLAEKGRNNPGAVIIFILISVIVSLLGF